MAKLQSDFTQGRLGRQLVRFSLPFLLSNLLQALYGVADMLIVGNFSGTAALSGVNIGGQITHLVAMMVSGLTVGGTVLVAQYFGARRERDAAQTIGTMFSLLALLGLLLTAVMLALSVPMLTALRTPAESFGEARRYLTICLLGTVFIFGYNAVAAVQRGMGDSKHPLMFVAVAAALNVGLDLVLVAGMGMGAAGAAIATVFSQGVSLLLSAAYLARNRFVFDFRLKSFAIRRDKALLLLRIGLPSSLQSIITNLSFLLMTAIVNGFGMHASAAVGIVSKFNSFGVLPAVAMSSAVSSVAAQNIGAGQLDRAKQAMRYGMGIAVSISLLVFALAQGFPQAILLLFDRDPLVIEQGVRYMRTFSFDYLLVPFVFCMNGLMMGAGHSTMSCFNSILSSILLRMPVASLMGGALGLAGVGMAAPAASFASVLLGAWFIRSGRWLHNKTGIRREGDAA